MAGLDAHEAGAMAAPPVIAPPAPPTGATPHAPPGKPFARLVLEVALIAAGVFLGLLGDQWRERAQHRDLAHAALRHFRDEFRVNRQAVADVRAHHLAGARDISAYFQADAATRVRLGMPFQGTHPAFLQYAAWDLAIATQSLAYVDAELAHTISRVYAVQRQLDEATRDVTLVMYAKAGGGDPGMVSFLGSMATYFGDCNLIEPRLLAQYDEVLPRLDHALGDRSAPSPPDR